MYGVETSKPRKIPVKVLAGDDRISTGHLCDACHVARATYRATHWGIMRTILLCGSHMRKHKTALEEQGWEIGEVQ